VVLAAWRQAVERFMKQLSDPNAEPTGTFRSMIDRWVKVANDTLIEVHRSPEFLEAQQRVTRSTTEYRLLEREIAEAYCEAGHIPTRSEMDEVQRGVVELRREVRELRRQLKSNGGTPA
jgi:polyhydroxyalkanoate synthesis regulator phasin